jgi:hypothetical protein
MAAVRLNNSFDANPLLQGAASGAQQLVQVDAFDTAQLQRQTA